MTVPFHNVELSLEDSAQCSAAARDLAVILNSNWKKENLEIEIFTAGITNKIFAVSASPTDKLIFRVFGKNTEKVIDRAHELQSWAILAEHGLAAKLHAKFVNGLVCGYAPGKPLVVANVRDPIISSKIAKAIAKMHNIPLKNSTPCLERKTNEFLKNLVLPFQNSEKQSRYEAIFTKSLQSQVDELNELTRQSGENEAFCHNDLLVHNILYDQDTEKISFIDYEYADCNYALFDIANHFNEYSGVDNADYNLCPSTNDKRKFINTYLDARYGSVDDVVASRMLKNTPLFEAASHLFWALWALVQAQNSLIDFDFLEYAILRYSQYKLRLAKFKKQL